MLKRRFIFLSVLFFVSMCSFAQVNLQTGSATFSLPMFNWQDDKSRLNSVVALSYNSGSGLKVNDLASNVGQGWSLIQGGVITRMQVGEPDDQVANESSDPNANYPAGILYATTPAYNGCPNALTKYPLYKKQNQVYSQHNVTAEDKQPDYFTFQFNGKAGMFVLDPTDLGPVVGNCKSLGDTKMKITFQQDGNLISQGIRTKIASFTIQDADGLIYKFTVPGKTKTLAMNYCDITGYQLQHLPKFRNLRVYQQTGFDNQLANPWIINNWFLSEIDDPFTQRQIFFTYEPRTITPTSENPYNAGTDFSYNSVKDYAVVSYKKTISQTQEISSIAFPDGHAVNFHYSNTDRYDFPGEKALSSVDVTYSGRSLSKYLLSTTYIIRSRYGNPTQNFKKNPGRLYLRSVQKVGPDLKEDSPPYIFDYYVGSNVDDDFVPPPFFYAKDIWGFYNGKNSVRYEDNTPVPLDISVQNLLHDQIKGLCFMHSGVSGAYLNAKDGYAKYGLLRQIIYPTGGTLTYEYAQNYGIISGQSQSQMVGGVHVSKTSSTDGGYSNGCNNAISTQYNYVLNDSTTIPSLWGLEMPINGKWTASHYDPKDKIFHWALSCPFGCCYYKYMYPGMLSAYQSLDISGFQHIMNTIQPFLNILSIVGTVMDVATLIGSTAPGFGTIAAVVVDVLGGLVTLAVTCLTDYHQDPSTTIYYNMDLNGISPLPAQFKRVEIIEGTGGIGKTVQTFTCDDDYSLWVGPGLNFAFAAKQRFAPWAYGLPRFTTVYDVNGNKIKETENQYDFSKSQTLIDQCLAHCGTFGSSGLYSPFVACKCDVVQSYSQRKTDWSDPSQYNAPGSYISTQGGNDQMKVDYYGMYTGRTELARTYERTFRTSDATQFVETLTSYTYNNSYNYELNSITTTESNGDIHSKGIKYTTDYYGDPITTLVNNNVVTLPVETTNSVFHPSGSGWLLLNEQVTEFTQVGNGDIKPYRKLDRRFNQPENTFYYYGGPGSDISNYKIIQTFTYDGSGNLLGIKDEGNRNVTNIYAYNDKYIVGSVINADPILDKPAYTSFENATVVNPGGWSIGGTISYNDPGSAVTGQRTYRLLTSGGSTLSASGLNTSKPYTLSFWSDNSNVTVVGGATLAKTGPSYNGFTYFEYDIAQGTSSVTVRNNTTTNNSNIDELRLYPKNARMRTVTYDEIIGKTSECDENNRITYYEYDNLGRLRFIKDESKNIVKMYEYNNVSPSKQNGCPAIYHNHFIQEIFTKNSCGTGFVGTDVPVTVAANMYSSNISQADADAQAENWLLANGQGMANTNGTCLQIFYSPDTTVYFTSQCEEEGYVGTSVAYHLPYGLYTSTIDLADARQKALDDIDANGQSYANDHGTCVVDTHPDWVWLDGAQTTCQNVNGQMHQMVFATDQNPNSPTYGQSSWQDAGPQSDCNNIYCSFTGVGDFSVLSGSPSNNGTVVSFYIAFRSNSGSTNWSGINTIASIDAECRPSVNRQFNTSEGGRTWTVTVTTGGQLQIQLVSGTPPGPGASIGFTGCSYNL